MNVQQLPQLHPLEEHNQSLVKNVRPADWQNPKADGRYNLVVIGAGTAGLGREGVKFSKEEMTEPKALCVSLG